MKRISAILMAVMILTGMTTALADNAGTSSNPLITRSYLETTLIPNITEAVDGVVRSYSVDRDYDAEAKRVYDMAMGRVIPEEYAVATGYEAVSVPAGGKITVMTGASVLVSYGSVSLTVQSGEVINVDSAVTASNPLSANIRYFAAEDTVAVYTARQDSVCLVNGPYMLSDGAEIIENSGFDDIDEYSEYYDIVMTLADRGIMSGVSRGSFELKTDVTELSIVESLWNMAGRPGSDAKTWADSRDIWTVTDDEEVITHEELAYILYKYAKNSGLDTTFSKKLTVYDDYYEVSPEYSDAVRWALDKGIIKGSVDTVIEPQDVTTRQQAAEALYGVLQLSE